MHVKEMTQHIWQRVSPYLMEEKPSTSTERCCISLSEHDITLIELNKTNTNSTLVMSDIIQYDEPEHIPLVLAGIIKKQALEKTPFFWLLSPESYQLFLVDSLPVKAEEMKDALNWRIRSLITFPIEEATVDYFLLPAPKSSPDNPMIAAVVAHRDQLRKIINLITRSDAFLTTIDIPELAMRNLSALYEQDEKSTAFLYFNASEAILNITSQKVLYFTRRLPFVAAKEMQTQEYESFCLDILRYFDYFQTKWRFPSPSRLFIASENEHMDAIMKALTTHLSLTIEAYKLPAPYDTQTTLTGRLLLAYGCALREEPT